MRHTTRTYLVATANGQPIGVYRTLPKRFVGAGSEVLVWDLGRLDGQDHGRLVAAVAALRELPYLAEGAPALLLYGGTPATVRQSAGPGRVLDLLRTVL
jgi:hypothetical protein